MDTHGLFTLEGRTALITGGATGIGRMIAEGFLDQGCTVYIASRDLDKCGAAAKVLGPRCHAVQADVATVDGRRSLASQLAQRLERLDILVNNAGYGMWAGFAEYTEETWDNTMDVNLKAPFFLTQALHPLLKASAASGRPSKVINVSSIDGLRMNDWETYSYHASKSGLLHLTRRMAATLIADNINVTAIAPGAFPSEMNVAARDRGDNVGRAIPNGRVGSREDIAAAAIYLAARSGDYVVGASLVVDGGLTYAELGKSISGEA